MWCVNYCRCQSKGKIKYKQLSQKIPGNKDDFENFRKWQLNFRSWKTGKGHGRSRDLKSSKEYEPWTRNNGIYQANKLESFSCKHFPVFEGLHHMLEKHLTFFPCSHRVYFFLFTQELVLIKLHQQPVH